MLKLKDKSLDLALAHIEKFGDTNIFPVPFEFKAIRHSWDSLIKPYLIQQDMLNWVVRPSRRCLTPKHRYGFRISTQLDPLDSIVITAIIGEIGQDIEDYRIPTKKNVAFSYRFKTSEDGNIYDPDFNYQSFQSHSRELADNKSYKYVVVADIADFFPRIYSHPLENALYDCTSKSNHVTAIKKILKSWNFTISVGIPVGIGVSMLLAELILDVVDRGLQEEGATHCRYVDDYRIFCTTEKEAYERLSFLANILYESNSLTLQQHKTSIIPIETFKKRYLVSESKRELESLSSKLGLLLDQLGVIDQYEEIDYDNLDEEDREKIDGLNLVEILKEQVKSEDIDISIVKFVLRRLRQFDDIKGVNLVLKNIDKLYPVFTDAVRYIQELRALNIPRRNRVGKILLDQINTTLVGHLDFHRLWIFNTFTENTDWDNASEFAPLYKLYSDSFSRRELILALGRTHQQSWFKINKRSISIFDPWQKRAFLAAASCLPGDECRHWHASIYGQLDPLEKSIVNWVKANPF